MDDCAQVSIEYMFTAAIFLIVAAVLSVYVERIFAMKDTIFKTNSIYSKSLSNLLK